MASRQDIEFESEGTTLRGWLYTSAETGEAQPTVVMAHGYSAVKEQYLDRYAEVFAARGLAVVVFDHANFGASDGETRQEVDPQRQIRGYRDAISFAQTRPELDPDRIGVWGTSYSGGHALVVAAHDKRVRAVVSQVPTINGFENAQRRTPPHKVAAQRAAMDADRLARFRGEPPVMVPVVAEGSGPCALPGADSYDFFTVSAEWATSWRNEVTFRSAEMAREYSPVHDIGLISPTPLLLIVAENDVLTLTDVQLAAYEQALEPKALRIIPGGHFAPYVEQFTETSDAAADWFAQHLIR